MQKFYTGITNERKPIVVIFAIAFVVCLVCSSLVGRHEINRFS